MLTAFQLSPSALTSLVVIAQVCCMPEPVQRRQRCRLGSTTNSDIDSVFLCHWFLLALSLSLSHSFCCVSPRPAYTVSLSIGSYCVLVVAKVGCSACTSTVTILAVFGVTNVAALWSLTAPPLSMMSVVLSLSHTLSHGGCNLQSASVSLLAELHPPTATHGEPESACRQLPP